MAMQINRFQSATIKLISTMFITDDVHRQFAEFFDDRNIWPYAYVLSKKLAEGNICIDLLDPTLFEGTTPYTEIAPIAKVLENKQLVSTSPTTLHTPFVFYNDALYLQRYFIYETICVEKITALIQQEATALHDRQVALIALRELIGSLQATYAIQGSPIEEQTDWQLVAVLQALLNNFSIITGGPGTGKTTTLAKLLILLFEWQPHVKVALAAPTGKAAMRMHDALKNSVLPYSVNTKQKIDGLQPSTLHSLLGYRKDTVTFKYHASNTLPYDWVIVDEASMIDLPMFAKLLDALAPHTRILLLGDKDQLASVEAGSLLGDLCASLPQLNQFREEQIQWINQFITDQPRSLTSKHITQQPTLLSSHILELKYSHRFNSMGAIGKLSRAVITSNLDALQACISVPDDQIVFYDELKKEAIEEIAKAYSAYLQEPDIAKALRLFNEQRILVAVRAGAQGLYTINKIIEEQLKKMNLIKPDAEFYENKPIMVTRNSYDLGLFNGDVGIIRADGAGVLKVWFDAGNGTLKSVLPAYFSNYETVYAMTIHKSQGSEFDKVMLVLPQGIDMPLLTRELLYTAITRAKSKLVIVGATTTIMQAAQSSVHRISGIKNRMEGLKPEEGSV
jgi:exodeoxyribonuclease V alpha subunit